MTTDAVSAAVSVAVSVAARIVTAMTDDFDLDDPWRTIAAIARDWAEPLREGDGTAEAKVDAELDAAEARLGHTLPAALREAYRLLGHRPDLTSNQDQLLAPDELRLDGDRGVLVYRVENQAGAYWGIRVTDLELADPPVLLRSDLARPRPEDWEPWLDRVSTAFVEIVLSETFMRHDDLTDFSDGFAEDEPTREVLDREYTRLPLPEYPLGQDEGCRWYVGGGVLLRADPGNLLNVRARTPEALDALRDRFPGAWINTSR